MKSLVLSFTMLWFSVSSASLVAVIDTGVDIDHPELAHTVWSNPIDSSENGVNGIDEDFNGYKDDFHGWNFVGDNNLVIDYEYFSTFSTDVAKYFELQYLKYIYNKGVNHYTQEFADWYYNVLYKDNVMNPEIAEAVDFHGDYAHGTHVAGIVAQENSELKLLTVKNMGTTAKLNFRSEDTSSVDATEIDKKAVASQEKIEDIKSQLTKIAQKRSQRFVRIVNYIKGHDVRVANASFGTGFDMTYSWLKWSIKNIDESQLIELTMHFQAKLVALSKDVFGKADNTLFVVAAGNDTRNNDIYPDYPASIVSDNVISIAATWDRNEIADFSSFGTKTVHVAAPGVGILSAAPGGNYLYMNGTSQAAPYVSKVASMMVDENPNLTPREIKELLIGTVDKKEWLANKVSSSGIVNLERAKIAAFYTAMFPGSSLDQVILAAIAMVPDVPEAVYSKSLTDGPVLDFKMKSFVTKRPSSFIFE